MQESACRGKSENTGLRCESLPFSEIPGQSKLFLDYLNDPLSLKEFYPSAVANHDDLVKRVPEVLSNYTTDRNKLGDILRRQNTAFGAGAETLANIERLRAADCVAVLTGQQAGLFTGPLYTIYKALTAIRSAACLTQAGINAVPVFWTATEDHDFEEISAAFAVATDGSLVEAKIGLSESEDEKPVGDIPLDASIETVLNDWMSVLPASESKKEIEELLRDAYTTGSTIGEAFCKLIAKLFARFGLIVFDPLDKEAKNLCSPIYRAAVERGDEIVRQLLARSERLEAAGYHSQVLIEKEYVPLFWHDGEGKRRSLKQIDDGVYRVNGTSQKITTEQLLNAAGGEPQRLSPGVMLRPVVQDFLFPTICYFGGGAEIAYFAQTSEVYHILERPVTPILHRQGFTIVEPKHSRTMEKYNLTLNDLFAGLEKLLPRIVDRVIDAKTPAVFADAEEKINTELNRLDGQLSSIDTTLAESLAKRRRKIIYHIGALRNKFRRTSVEKDETVKRRMKSLFTTLLPNGALQERTLNFVQFADRYGENFLDWVYDFIDLDDNDHRILYL